VIQGAINFVHLIFNQLLQRYEKMLTDWMDDRPQCLLQFLRDGQYLQEDWSWIGGTDQYKQWVSIYMENKEKLNAIAEYNLSMTTSVLIFGIQLSKQKTNCILPRLSPVTHTISTWLAIRGSRKSPRIAPFKSP